ncbi:uncharacterized protein LOC119589519 [Penaeus monodon]|uniref:uncharacterized protein LOC119589519 n=1 Tax=Penaeus monodon TaxID=6687 RepID=UPI0018A72E73|nr:uncharacterized protein LOC119589519 [Penaeus monodon]
MADQSDRQDTGSAESPLCPEPQLEVTQDLELLAQEIAEAAVEEEEEEENEEEEEEEREGFRRETSQSPILLCDQTEDTCKENTKEDTVTTIEERMEEEGTKEEDKQRSASPVDETSWVLVDAEDENGRATKGPNDSPDLKYNLLRKFLVAGDLRQKLTDAGLVCDEEDTEGDADEGLRDSMVMSCSESMVICDLPQTAGDEETTSLHLKNFPDCSNKSDWRGTFAGARVEVEVERKGGLQVAAVRVWHVDLLSALASLQSLANTAGLVSYADVDVTSLLARAA